MSNENKIPTVAKEEVKEDIKEAAKSTDAKNSEPEKTMYAQKKKQDKRPKRGGANAGKDKPTDEFEQRIVDIARVTRVMAGGKRMRFRACVAIGNKKGKVAVGLAKGADVTIAVNKAVNKAKKDMIEVPIVNDTIPHEIYWKKGAAKVLLIPASKGRGVIAGGAVRIILELAGVHNITSKILGTNNKVNIVKCTIEALDNLRKIEKKAPKPENKEAKKPEDKKEERPEAPKQETKNSKK
jgi:small subunit ribosomal protein S5